MDISIRHVLNIEIKQGVVHPYPDQKLYSSHEIITYSIHNVAYLMYYFKSSSFTLTSIFS